MTKTNINNFPHLITLIDPTQPEFNAHTEVYSREQPPEHWVKVNPDKIVQVWEPQDMEDHVEYQCTFEDTQHYRDSLKAAYNWPGIVADAKADAEGNPNDPQNEGWVFLGKVTHMSPSCKYYMPWAAGDTTAWDVLRDQLYFEALDDICEEYGGSLMSGEGDPLDQYFVLVVESESNA